MRTMNLFCMLCQVICGRCFVSKVIRGHVVPSNKLYLNLNHDPMFKYWSPLFFHLESQEMSRLKNVPCSINFICKSLFLKLYHLWPLYPLYYIFSQELETAKVAAIWLKFSYFMFLVSHIWAFLPTAKETKIDIHFIARLACRPLSFHTCSPL